MKQTTKEILIALSIITGIFWAFNTYAFSLSDIFPWAQPQAPQTFGAFGDPFISLQLATDPDNGECLTTDGTDNIWSSSCGGGGTFSWDVTSYGVSTSTTLGFLQGFLSTASSTINASTTVTGVLTATGGLYGSGLSTCSGSDFLQWSGGSFGCAAPAGSGDITAVGDVADGAAFNGTQGTTLTFNNAGGDATLAYDGTDLESSHLFKALGFWATASSTFQNFTGVNATTSQSTTTNFHISSLFNFDSEIFDSLTDDATLDNNGGDLRVVDVTCTNCLTTTEVASADLATLATNVSDADFGEVTVSSGTWTLDDNTTVTGWTLGNFLGTNATITNATSTSIFSLLLQGSTLRIGGTATTTIDAEGDIALPSAGTFTIDSELFDSLTDDATLANNTGDLQVVDVTCTNCLTTTEVASADLATNVSDTDFGDVTVASGAWAVEDDSHAHTSGSLSGIDISADTNLTAGDNLTLNDDDLDLDTTLTGLTKLTTTYSSTTDYASFETASTSALVISNSLNIFGGGAKTTANALCIQLTGHADLCDGGDATGAGGAYPFTTATTYATTTQATTTPLWLQGNLYSLFASSTSVFDNASTSQLTAGDIYLREVGTQGYLLHKGSSYLNVLGGGGLYFEADGTDDADTSYLQMSPGAGGDITLDAPDLVTISGAADASALYLSSSQTQLYSTLDVYLENSGNHTYKFGGPSNQDVTFNLANIATSDKTYTLSNFSGSPALGSYHTGFTDGHVPFGASGLLATSTALIFDSSLSKLTATNLQTTNATNTNATSTNLDVSGLFSLDGLYFDSFTDDATLDNASGDLQVVDLTCTNCIDDNEITTNAGTALSADLEEEVTEGSLSDSVIVEGDLKVVNAPGDEEFFTYESTTGDFEWHTCTEMLGAGLCDGSDDGGASGWVWDIATTYSTTTNATTTPSWFKTAFYASSTASFPSVIDNFTATRSTTTSATSTDFFSTVLTATSGFFTNLWIGADTLAEYISDTAGAFFTGNTETGITVTYQDADNTVDVVCNTADTSTFGCLTDTDWDTFNGKENVLTAGDNLTRTANDFDLDTTLTGLTKITTTYSSTTDYASFLTASSTFGRIGTLTLDTDLTVANGGTGASTLTDHGVLVGSGTSAIDALAVGTNGQILVGSTTADPVFATLTCADGLSCTTGAGTLEIDFDGGDAPLGELGGTWASPTLDDSVSVASWLFTTSVNIPNAAAPTVDATGEIAIDTTTDLFEYYGSASKRLIPPFQRLGFTYATTSWSATTTIMLGPAYIATTIDFAYCETNTGTVGVSLYDGTNRASYIVNASTTINKFAFTTNNTFTAGESMRVDLGTPVSSPTRIACSIGWYPTDD